MYATEIMLTVACAIILGLGYVLAAVLHQNRVLREIVDGYAKSNRFWRDKWRSQLRATASLKGHFHRVGWKEPQ
jgi:hypothetical protein